MSKQISIKDIEKFYNKAEDVTSKLIEQYARKILRKHTNLNTFVMGMGGWFFTIKIGRKGPYGAVVKGGADEFIHSWDALSYMRPIEKLIIDWDEYLKITGEPMKLTANGPVIRDF